jgi:hypothetical protein
MQAITVIHIDEAKKATVLQPHNVHPLVRDLPYERAAEVLPLLATRVTRNDRDEYVLHAHVRGKGGGPVLGICTAVGTRVVAYGALGAFVVGEFMAGGPLAVISSAPELYEAVVAVESGANTLTAIATAAPTL